MGIGGLEGRNSPSGVQVQSPGRGFGDEVPPEAKALLINEFVDFFDVSGH